MAAVAVGVLWFPHGAASSLVRRWGRPRVGIVRPVGIKLCGGPWGGWACGWSWRASTLPLWGVLAGHFVVRGLV